MSTFNWCPSSLLKFNECTFLEDNIELDSVLDNIILPERVPYYIIEDTTDSNNIRFTQEVTPVIHDSTQDLNLDQNIGEYFKYKCTANIVRALFSW